MLFPYFYDLCCLCLNLSFFVIYEDVVTNVFVVLFQVFASLSIILFPSPVSSFLYSSAYASSFAIATAFFHSFFVTLYTSLSSSSFDCCHFSKASFLAVVAYCMWSVHHQVSFSTYRPPGYSSPNLDLAISKIQFYTSLYSISYQEPS